MSDTKEITADSSPNEVVAFLNDGLKSGASFYTMRDVLTDIQDGELPLPGFNAEATLMANIVNNWLDGSGDVYIVCDKQDSHIVYTLSEVRDVSGPSLVWWWKKVTPSDYARLMVFVQKGRELQFLLHEARDNHFMLTEAIQKIWEAARSLPIEH